MDLGFGPTQFLYLHKVTNGEENTCVYAQSGIRRPDPSVRTIEDSGYRGRPFVFIYLSSNGNLGQFFEAVRFIFTSRNFKFLTKAVMACVYACAPSSVVIHLCTSATSRKLTVYKTTYIPAITYGCESWPFSSKHDS